MGGHLRRYWSIENQLHWSLDVLFREDASQARKDKVPENLNVLRKIALVQYIRLNETLAVGGARGGGQQAFPQRRPTAAVNRPIIGFEGGVLIHR
jgi:hypothetical protein